MPDDAPTLRPADRPNLLHSLAYALKRGRSAGRQERDDLMARLVAEQLLEHLERSNYVVMQGPPARAHSVGYTSPSHLKD